MISELEEINQQIADTHPSIEAIKAEISKAIVDQTYLVERLLIGLLANGHVLLEGVPGLAKTARRADPRASRPCSCASAARAHSARR